VKLQILTGEELVKILEKIGFKVVRQRGSHVRMKHKDGRVTSVPIHKGRELPK